MNLELRGKTGIVTGASRGIGAGIARTLAREGCRLVLVARNADDLSSVATDVRALGGQALASAVDLRQYAAVRAVVAATLNEYGRLDFVIANAGSARTGDFLELTDEDWDEGFNLKFFGHMRLLRAAWPHLKSAKGSAVLLAGGAGHAPKAHSMITGAVNAAVMNFAKALADRGLADGVQVNCVLPGSIRTERWRSRLRKVVEQEGISEAEAEKRLVAKGRQVRMGEPEDIGAMIAFILSPHGSYVQGALIDVDGGRNKGM